MSESALRVVRLCAVLASVFCLGGGLWLLTAVGFNHGDDAQVTAMALYFIGKGFFVGPLLWMATTPVPRGGPPADRAS